MIQNSRRLGCRESTGAQNLLLFLSSFNGDAARRCVLKVVAASLWLIDPVHIPRASRLQCVLLRTALSSCEDLF